MKYTELFKQHAFTALYSRNAVVRSAQTPTWHVGRTMVGPTLCGLVTDMNRWNVELFPIDAAICGKCRAIVDPMVIAGKRGDVKAGGR